MASPLHQVRDALRALEYLSPRTDHIRRRLKAPISSALMLSNNARSSDPVYTTLLVRHLLALPLVVAMNKTLPPCFSSDRWKSSQYCAADQLVRHVSSCNGTFRHFYLFPLYSYLSSPSFKVPKSCKRPMPLKYPQAVYTKARSKPRSPHQR